MKRDENNEDEDRNAENNTSIEKEKILKKWTEN